MALCRRLAHGRSQSSFEPADFRNVWRSAAPPARRARAPRRAVEIRIQVGQVDRQDSLHARSAENGVEPGRTSRIRVLFECEPASRSPALVASKRAAYRRRWIVLPETQNSDVQRL